MRWGGVISASSEENWGTEHYIFITVSTAHKSQIKYTAAKKEVAGKAESASTPIANAAFTDIGHHSSPDEMIHSSCIYFFWHHRADIKTIVEKLHKS